MGNISSEQLEETQPQQNPYKFLSREESLQLLGPSDSRPKPAGFVFDAELCDQNSLLISNPDQENKTMDQSHTSCPAISVPPSQLTHKRYGSPLSVATHQFKRHQSESTASILQTDRSLPLAHLIKEQQALENVCARISPTNSNCFSTQPRALFVSDNGNDRCAKKLSTPPHSCHISGSSPLISHDEIKSCSIPRACSSVPSSLSHPSSSRRSSSHNTVDSYSDHLNPASRWVSDQLGSRRSSSHNRFQHVFPSTRTPEPRHLQQRATSPLGTPQYQCEQGHEDIFLPFVSPMRNSYSGPPLLQSPIWNDGVMTRSKSPQVESLRSASPTLSSAKGGPSLDWCCPFWDGGLPGEGGESSDESTRMFPNVQNHNVFVGGTRSGKLVPITYDAPFTPFRPLKEAMTQQDVWRGQAKIDRRREKLLARDLARWWRKAVTKNDYEEMQRLTRKAKLAKLPAADVSPRRHLSKFQSSAPGAFRHRALPPQLQRTRLSDPGSRRCRLSRPGSAISAENSRIQGHSDHVFVPRPHRSENKIRTPPASTVLKDHDSVGFEDEMDADDEEEFSSMLGYIKNTRRHSGPSTQRNTHGSSYRPTSTFSDGTTSYNRRSLTKDLTSGTPRLLRSSNSVGLTRSNERVFQVLVSNLPPRGKFSACSNSESSEIINLCSSTETSPSLERSVPMKAHFNLCSSTETSSGLKCSVPMKNRISFFNTQKKKMNSESLKARNIIHRKMEITRKKVDLESARQQMHADRIISSEINATHEELFGEAIGATPEEIELLESIKKREAQQKREAVLKEKLLKEEENRIKEAARLKAVEEAREIERLRNEREEKVKKAKRDAERKMQEEHDEAVKEKKRQRASDLIQAARAREDAEARELEKKKEIQQQNMINQLKIAVLKKELEVKALQFSSLRGAKGGSSGISKDSDATNRPIQLGNNEDSLFVSKEPADEAKVSFRARIAQERFSWDERRGSEGTRCHFQPHSSPAYMKPSSTVPTPDQQKNKGKKLYSSKKKALSNGLGTTAPAPVLNRAIDPKPQPVRLPPRKLTYELSKLDKIIEVPPSLPSAPQFPANIFYTSEVKTVEEVVREKDRNERIVREDESKRKRTEERWRKNFAKIAAKYRQKLLASAAEDGYTRTEAQLDILVDNYMRERDSKYRKSQAKKARNDAGRFSSDSYVTAQLPFGSPKGSRATMGCYLTGLPSIQSIDESQVVTQPQSSSQPLPSTASSYVSQNNERESQLNIPCPAIHTIYAELNDKPTAVMRDRCGRFARAAAKTHVGHFETDSDESEEDPDPTLEAMLVAKKKANVAADESEGNSKGSKFDADDGESLVQDLKENSSEQFEDNQLQLQRLFPSSSQTDVQSRRQFSATIDATKSYPSPPQSINSAESQIINKPEEKVRIYSVQKMAIVDGVEGEIEVIKNLTDRDEANKMGEKMFESLCSAAQYDDKTEFCNEERLYEGKVTYDVDNMTTVQVTSKIESPFKYACLDVEKIKKLHGEDVWIIVRELKKRLPGDEDHEIMTHIKETPNNNVYTDRKLANHYAAEGFISFLKPTDDNNAVYAEEWAGQYGWSKMVREELKICNSTAGKLFSIGVEREGDQLGWFEWDEVTYGVEIRRTVGPRN